MKKYKRSQSSRAELQSLCRKLFFKNIEYRRRQKVIDDLVELVLIRMKEIPEESKRIMDALKREAK